jgi:transglutaminase-like putative cysteine protease
MAALHGKQPLLASLRSTLQALLLSLPLMLVLFVVMPRLPGPLWSMPAASGSASSGLAEDMAPGSISQLIPSNEPVFTVVFNGTVPARRDFYWRVMLFDQFDGRRWFNAGAIAEPGGRVVGGTPVGYTLTVAPDKGRVPVLDLPGDVAEGLRERAGMVWQQQRPSETRIRYRADSHAGALLAEPLDAAHLAFYRHLPAGNDRARALAAAIWARSRGDEAYIRALLGHFRLESFRYTLSPPPLSGAIVDQFLFETRQGFCEHYASALAFLARAAGIPSRVVVGYQGGEYNAAGGFWQVRSSDAHAWVEVWLASRQGWWRVDPTAAVSPDRIEQGVEQAVPTVRSGMPILGGSPPEWMLALRQHWLAANFAWQQWVVGYDAGRQRSLFRALGLGQEVDVPAVLKGLLAGSMLMIMPLWWWWRRLPQREPLLQGWLLLGYRLRRVGVTITPADTPGEVLHRAAHLAEVDRAQLAALLEAYVGLRYRTSGEAAPLAARRWLGAVRRFHPARGALNGKTPASRG